MLMPFSPSIWAMGQHAGPVGDREMEVIAAPDLVGGVEARPRGPTRTRGSSAREVRTARPITTSIRSPTTAEAVGIIAGPAAVEEGVAHGVADHPDRVVRPAHLGQRRPLLHQRRRDPQLQARFGQLRQRQQLDGVAELAGVLEVGQLQPVDALAGNVVGVTLVSNASWARIASLWAVSVPSTSRVGSASA